MSKKVRQGDIVHYRLTENDASFANVFYNAIGGTSGPVQIVRGDLVSPGERVPLMAVKVSGERLSGPAFLAGSQQVSVQNAKEGDEPGEWSWGKESDED